ncbi:MAG: VWA domain-containing protein [Deltaproteobacteria bacterium]|nr:VWA domain-containing protein [Deltaproteobacteria bacterium]
MYQPFRISAVFWVLLALAPLVAAEDPVLWPEAQRSFYQDGPASLLDPEEREAFASLDEVGRELFIDSFLERIPATDGGLKEAIRRRQLLVTSNDLPPSEIRSQLLFLQGPPPSREVIECGLVYRPMELWNYGTEENPAYLVIYQPGPDEPFRLWVPTDSKRVLYTQEMEYFLDQWEELRKYITGKRFDYQLCKRAKFLDKVTGVRGLTGFMEDRPLDRDMTRFLDPPADLSAWASKALSEEEPKVPRILEIGDVKIQYPKLKGPRMLTRVTVNLPDSANLEVATEGDEDELDLSVEGSVEQDGKVFDTFRVRFTLNPPEEPAPVALVVERALRPDRSFLLRLKVSDEVAGTEARLNRSFTVPAEAEDLSSELGADDVVAAVGQQISMERLAGADALVLVPPESDVVVGLWRAEALVAGERITKVVFVVDDKVQLTRTRPPFTAEVRLTKFPTEQVIRIEGYDAAGELVLTDEVVLNQPRGALRTRILEPKRGVTSSGTITARAEVVVPEERRVERVEFLVNDALITTLESPPWESTITVPDVSELSYLTVVAYLDDESRAEDVRFLNSPDYLEEVDVSLVELFTTVTNREGRLVPGLAMEDFEVLEEGKKQVISKFELVENLPLTVGLTIDTSGSMANSIYEAQQAAIGFVDNILTRRDKAFAISFADRPVLLMPPTNDSEAVSRSLEGLLAAGFTSLHDAVIHSLYYFRGVRGRRALVVLSDGDDTASHISFRDALEYARRSGVAIYTIGLGVSGLDLGIRDKLKSLAAETGGQSFLIKKADELAGVYEAIEAELRSQYLIAYASKNQAEPGTYRTVEVKTKKRGLKARTTRGYYE